METDALRWFQQVADGVTVTEVSQVEHISQPGLSRALARLEAEVGTTLLRRQGRTLRMTEAGAAFKRHVDAALHELDDGLAAVEQLLDPETGTVGLAFERSMGTWLVPQLVRGFRADHPQVRVRLLGGAVVGGHGAEAAAAGAATGPGARPTDDGPVDLQLSSRRPTAPHLRWARLLSEPLVLVVPVGHRLAAPGTAVTLAKAAREPFVVLRGPSPFRRSHDELLAAAGVEPAVAFEADDLATVQGFVAAGLGVAVVPASGVGEPVEVVALADRLATRELGLVWSDERRMLPSAELFREHVRQQAAIGHLAAPFT